MNKKEFGYISLFSGAGGIDIGLGMANFKRLLCVEIDDVCQSTLSLNDPRVNLANEGNLYKLSSKEIMRQGGVRKKELFLLAGGPPCQPFSKLGFWSNG